MARSVLLVEPDLDLLGTLASELRARGLEVSIADSVQGAVARTRDSAPEVAVVSALMLETDSERVPLVNHFAELRLPLLVLVAEHGRDLGPDHFHHGSIDEISRRIRALPARAAAAAAGGGDVRGNLQQISLADLLQLLSMNRRSGTLSVTTQSGAGEVRIAEGQIVDAVYRRLEGEKALYRLLGESDGVFSFASGTPPSLRRIELSTAKLLLEGMRQIDETRRRRVALDAEDEALLAVVPPDSAAGEAAERVLEALAIPRTLTELLDEVSAADLDVLIALEVLLEGGRVRRIAAGAERVELADTERLAVLAALATRAARAGFRAPVRVGIAASPQRLVTLMHAVGRIADAMIPSEAVPAAPIPHTLATLRLGEGVELSVVGVPLVEAYAPLWALVLPSCAAVARFEPAASGVLELACSASNVPIVEAEAPLRDGVEVDPQQVAGLIRRLLERAAGSQ